jgi:hypothetical protein
MWQVCGWDRVDICMIFHKRAFDFFFIPLRNYELSKKCQLSLPTQLTLDTQYFHIFQSDALISGSSVLYT